MSQRRPALLAILPVLVLTAGVLLEPGLVRADRGERDLARSGMGARFNVLAATIESNARAEVVKRRLPGLLQSASLQDPRQADTVVQRIVQAVDRLKLSAGQTERPPLPPREAGLA